LTSSLPKKAISFKNGTKVLLIPFVNPESSDCILAIADAGLVLAKLTQFCTAASKSEVNVATFVLMFSRC